MGKREGKDMEVGREGIEELLRVLGYGKVVKRGEEDGKRRVWGKAGMRPMDRVETLRMRNECWTDMYKREIEIWRKEIGEEWTVEDLMEVTGMCESTGRKKLKTMMEKELVEVVRMVVNPKSRNGKRMRVYRKKEGGGEKGESGEDEEE